MPHILWWAAVGLFAGWLTGRLMTGEEHGALTDVVLGIAGALVGGFAMHLLGFSAEGGFIYTSLVATGGAVLLTFIRRKSFASTEAPLV